MVVFLGGKASGFKNVHDHDTYDVDGTRLFRVTTVFYYFSVGVKLLICSRFLFRLMKDIPYSLI